MEIKLDDIKEDSSSWWSICNVTNDTISKAIKNIDTKKIENSFIIDSSNVLQFTKLGPVVKHKDDDNIIEYLPVKKELSRSFVLAHVIFCFFSIEFNNID
jgi:hypothetical protein